MAIFIARESLALSKIAMICNNTIFEGLMED